jgi:hypothetical protein
METVRTNCPDGVPSSTQIVIGGKSKNSMGYVIEKQNQWHYIVPLTRDLRLPEAQRIAIAWDKAYHEVDFEIDYSTEGEARAQYQEIKDLSLKEIAMAAAKAQHTQWVNEMNESGWQYGTRFDQRNKRNPMLMPWEQLSDRIKLRELGRFQKLIDILDDMDLRLARKR